MYMYVYIYTLDIHTAMSVQMEEAWRRSSHAIHIAGLSRCKDAKTEICECKKDHATAEPTPLIVQKSEAIINKVAIEYPTLKLTRFPTSKK